MPRVENLGENVQEWYDGPDCNSGDSTHDVCQDCYRDLLNDPHAHDEELKPYHNGEPQGEDGWGGDVEHPPYEDDPDHYICQACGKQLTEEDY